MAESIIWNCAELAVWALERMQPLLRLCGRDKTMQAGHMAHWWAPCMWAEVERRRPSWKKGRKSKIIIIRRRRREWR